MKVYRGAVLLWMILIVSDGAAVNRMALIAALAAVAAAYVPVYRYLMSSPLVQSTRVTQMKGILKANICSGTICLALMLIAILSR